VGAVRPHPANPAVVNVPVEFKDESGEASRSIEGAASRLVRETATGVEASYKRAMSGPHHGRTYTRGKQTHKASAPGEAPAVDRGALSNSIETVTDEAGGVVASVTGTGLEYGALLEGGTATIEPRDGLAKEGERAKNIFQRRAQNL
jgi:hypothetical protein